MDIKELYYEADTRKHQQIVAAKLIAVAKRFLDRAVKHDSSKLDEPERSAYINPVYALNTEEVPYGSDRYKELTDQMGEGWEHHKSVNDHHIEFFIPYSVQTLNDPIRAMDMFALIEMLCDWIAAASRRGNEPGLALEHITKEFPINEQLQQVIRNTLAMIKDSV
uniref:Uncharacterized protein n=1 Tax=viral metagenome TaxID=1070528 RepID=A0A6M3K9K7_9ZZZZ